MRRFEIKLEECTVKVLSSLVAVLMIASGVTAAPRTLSQVIDSLSSRYDRVETYRADADVFEYNG